MATIPQLNLTFVDGQTCSAAQLNSIVAAINNAIVEINSTSALLETISKSELMVVASKSSLKTFDGDGQSNIIDGWTTTLNKNSIFNATTGIATIKTAGTYTIIAKTLISADNAISPRSKLWISANSNPIGNSEDTVFQEQTTLIQNYRRNHDVSATSQLSINVPVLLNVQVWGASEARIFGDLNTVIKIYREIS